MNMSLGVRNIFAFIYSLIVTYLIVYVFVIRTIYPVQLAGGDWGYLAVILGWFFYILLLLPVLIFVRPKVNNILYLLPAYIGILCMFILTFTGRAIFQPLYNNKIDEMQNDLLIKHMSYSYLGYQKRITSDYIDPKSEGTIEIENNVSFPIAIRIEPKYSSDDSFLQATCEINGEFNYQIEKGKNMVNYECYFSEDRVHKVSEDAITYTFRIEMMGNAAINKEEIFTSNQLTNLVNQ